MQHFTPLQLAEHLEKNDQTLTLLDVREPWEYDTCHIKDSVLIPMGQIANKLDEINQDHPIVVICHHGIRSRNIAMYLERNDFINVINLTGGIDAWAIEIDLDMAKY